MPVPPLLPLSAIRQPAFLYAADGTITATNDQAEALACRRLAGSSLATLVGIFDIRSQDGAPLLAADMPVTRALQGEEMIDVPLVITASDGRIHHILATASPFCDRGEILGALVIWQDVSTLETALAEQARLRLESETKREVLQVQGEELRQQGDDLVQAITDLDRQRRLLDAVLSTLPHWVSLWDRDRRLVWANARVGAQRGLPRETPDGSSWNRPGFDITGLRLLTEEGLRSLSAGKHFPIEVEVPGPEGPVWQAVTALPIFGDSVLVIAEDVTERKRVEDVLRRSERDLADYAQNLQRSNEELLRFAYVASHDLQEPLRSIISFSQLLERRYRGRLGPDADEYIQFIVEGGTRMQTLIQDLLRFSRIETKAQPFAPVDAGEVVADALRLMETPIREAGATVSVRDLPTVMADAAQLEQVFTNLVGNALKYRRLDVPAEVRISAEREGRFWRFAVADNGIGIEAEYYDRIFIIFQRLHTKDAFPGTGIGLAVVKKIVERHGGRIWVESMPGEGSTFFCTLPAT